MRSLALALVTAVALEAPATPARGAPSMAPQPNRQHPPGAAAAAERAELTLPPYPAPDSDEGKADLAIVLWVQRTRTNADVLRARSELVLDLTTFAAALGPGFDPAEHPRTQALLESLMTRAREPLDRAKQRFDRRRPYDADARVAPVVPRERSSSYPSGAAMYGVLLARVLSELAPERRAALLEAGLRAGYDRVLGGIHYPSDVLAGQQLGDALAGAMLADPATRQALRDVRTAEWRSAAAARP